MAITDPELGSAITPIDRFLAAQADLRVVERFARTDVSGRTGQWSDLIPVSAPADGSQYRFDVDLDSCTGCKACVTACHSLNGLDEGESFRSIGLLIDTGTSTTTPAGPDLAPAEQTITTTCHHCADPGCLNGCPAKAYEKDPVTGIVRHLDDACIGCQYCTLTCPYDVPVYNDRLGIVRKCDLCADRLADGEAPACVQGCPTEAITVTTVDPATVDPVTVGLTDDRLVPGAAPSALTVPTTRYHGRLLDGDSIATAAPTVVKPQHPHLPLVTMLVLSQWSVGLMVVAAVAAALGSSPANADSVAVSAALATGLGVASAGSSVAHLGQPLKAWRAVLGWSHSWLSREVLALSAYLGLGTAATGAALIGGGSTVSTGLILAATGLGLITVGCSVMIYVDTGRAWWRSARTGRRFGGTVAVGALSWIATLAAWQPGATGPGLAAAVGVSIVLIASRWAEDPATAGEDLDHDRTATLLAGPLRPITVARTAASTVGVGLLIIGVLYGRGGDTTAAAVFVTGAGVVVLAIGAALERRLFFQACAPATMPGAHR